MKLGFCTNICDGLYEIGEKLDCMICCGNFCPVNENDILTFSIINQADWIYGNLNKWIERYSDTCFILSSGPNDHIAKFYGSNLNFYVKGNYIQDEAMLFKGLRIYSMPWMPSHYSISSKYAFSAIDSSLYMAAVDSIPDDTDILLTWHHSYSKKNCKNIDEQGDIYLKKKIKSLKNLKIHAFGQLVQDNVIDSSGSHLIVCSNRASVGPYTIVEI
jgi:hypothetical protein